MRLIRESLSHLVPSIGCGFFSLCITSLLAVSGCQPGTSSHRGVVVSDGGPKTIITTHLPDGSVEANHGGDAELVGRKEIFVSIAAQEPTEVRTVLLTWWLAGHRVGSHTIETAINQVLPGNSSRGVNVVIPESTGLQVCEGLYYMWTVTYRFTDGVPGTFIGQPRLVMPTKTPASNGQIQQAMCVAPPGPDV